MAKKKRNKRHGQLAVPKRQRKPSTPRGDASRAADRQAHTDAETEAAVRETSARPNQLARDVHAGFVAKADPVLAGRWPASVTQPHLHCPSAVLDRFAQHGVRWPLFWKRTADGKLAPCRRTDTDWQLCTPTTLRALETGRFAAEKCPIRTHGASGGVARQWLHLTDECEHALRHVSRRHILWDEPVYRLGDDSYSEFSTSPTGLTNIDLGAIMLPPPQRQVAAFYQPLSYLHEGKSIPSYFTIGLSAAGHAVLYWATMHVELRVMLSKLKDHGDRASMPKACRLIIDPRPVLEWEQRDIDTLNDVRGEVLAFDRYWDEVFATGRRSALNADGGRAVPDASVAEQVTTNDAQSKLPSRKPEPATVAGLKATAKAVLGTSQAADWSDSWGRVREAAKVVVMRGQKNRVLTLDEVQRCVNVVPEVITFRGREIAAAWNQKYIVGS